MERVRAEFDAFLPGAVIGWNSGLWQMAQSALDGAGNSVNVGCLRHCCGGLTAAALAPQLLTCRTAAAQPEDALAAGTTKMQEAVDQQWPNNCKACALEKCKNMFLSELGGEINRRLPASMLDFLHVIVSQLGNSRCGIFPSVF